MSILLGSHLLGASLMYEGVSQEHSLETMLPTLSLDIEEALGTLMGAERRLALASLLCGGNRNIPGWYWVKDMPDERVAQWLEDVVMVHPDEEVRNVDSEPAFLETNPSGHD